MAGYQVFCGEFYGTDKSVSAIRGIIEGIIELDAEALDEPAVARLQAAFSDWPDYVEIDADDAAALLLHFTGYQGYLADIIGPLADIHDAIRYDENAPFDATEAKAGAGLGWRFYGLHSLCEACRVSIATREPVIICLD
jgi:hypothetical protein